MIKKHGTLQAPVCAPKGFPGPTAHEFDVEGCRSPIESTLSSFPGIPSRRLKTRSDPNMETKQISSNICTEQSECSDMRYMTEPHTCAASFFCLMKSCLWPHNSLNPRLCPCRVRSQARARPLGDCLTFSSLPSIWYCDRWPTGACKALGAKNRNSLPSNWAMRISNRSQPFCRSQALPINLVRTQTPSGYTRHGV